MRAFMFLILISLCSLSVPAFGNSNPKRYHSLHKVTVGPYDSYQSSAHGNSIYFTKNLRPATGVYVKSIDENESWPILSNLASSRDPSPSPDGRYIAFTWFKHDAKGNVCIKAVPTTWSKEPNDKNVQCFSGDVSQDHSPFWISPNELGFVSKPFGDKSYRLIRRHIGTGEQSTLASDLSSAPVLSPNGTLLAYNHWNPRTQSSSLVFRSLRDKNFLRNVELLIPGVSGQGAFSSDQTYYYFGHYLNAPDDKKLLDIQEKSTVFRIKVDEVLKGNKVLPEQLTSSEFNCHFPNDYQKTLYLTCAFEGSLDIYSIEPEGQIPSSWTTEDLEGAYQASRSYDERLFLLNRLKQQAIGQNQNDLIAKSFTNHLHNSEAAAALFELLRIPESEEKSGFKKSQKKLLQIWLRALKESEKEPFGRITDEFRGTVLRSIGSVQRIHSPGVLKIIVQGLLHQLIQNQEAQESLSQKVLLTRNTSAMEWFLAHKWLDFFWEKNIKKLANFRLSTLLHQSFGAEFRLKYAYEFLNWADQTLTEDEFFNIQQKIFSSLPSDDEIAILFESESHVRKLMNSLDKESATKAFHPLNIIFQNTSHRYHLRKTIYIRAIQKLSEGHQQDFMDFIASHWLRYTDTSQMEFSYASDQYLWSAMDHAYRVWHQKDLSRASSSFYSVLSQLDDYEAHLGYLAVNDQMTGSGDKVLETYEYLESLKKIAPDNRYFRSAYFILRKENTTEKELMQALSDLSHLKLRSGVSSEIICLLQGYATHKLFQQSLARHDPDGDKLRAAHRYYDMALDLSHDNDRVRSAVLSNLGLLHEEGGNYGVAAGYLKKRFQFPFISKRSEFRTRLLYSRVLFHSYRAREAIDVIKPLVKGARTSNERLILADRLGLYSIACEDFQNAAYYYQSFFENVHGSPSPAHGRQYLSLGYAYFKLANHRQAQKYLTMFLQLSPKHESKVDWRSGIYHGKRRLLMAYGLLSQLPLDADERISYRQSRIKLLKSAGRQTMSLGLSEADWLSTLAKAYQQLSADQLNHGKMPLAHESMIYGLEYALKWSELTGSTGIVIYRTIVNALSLALLNPDINESSGKLREAASRLKSDLQKDSDLIPVRREQLKNLTNLMRAFDRKFSIPVKS